MQQPYNYCRITNCLDKETHITIGHRCKQCNYLGHCINECGDEDKINQLKNISAWDRIKSNEYCDIYGCEYFWLHTNQGHICGICDSKLHSKAYCDYILFNIQMVDLSLPAVNNSNEHRVNIKCPLCLEINHFDINNQIIYGLEQKCKVCLTNINIST